MSIRQSPPGEGGQSRRVHFTYTPTAHGSQWHAYIAGPCVWVMAHTRGKTKPCLQAITGGALTCPMCESVTPPEVVGYQPLYRELDGKPVMVIVHESVRESVDAWKLHSRVLVGREHAKTDGVYLIRPLKGGAPYSTTLAARQRAADVVPTLIRVWNLPALTEWWHAAQGIPQGGVIHPPVNPAVRVYTPMPAAGQGRVDDAVPLSEMYPTLMDRARRAVRADDRTSLDPPPETAGG